MTFRLNISKLLVACGIGVSMPMLGSGIDSSLVWSFIPSAHAEGREEQVELLGIGDSMPAIAANGTLLCDESRHRALLIVPELLALADWPLDDREPDSCVNSRYAAAAVGEAGTTQVFGVASAPVLVSNQTLSGVDAPVGEKSSIQPDTAERQQNPLGHHLAAISTESLDEIRGGFELEGSSLKFSIGIERAVFVNGSLVASSVLVPKDLQLRGSGPAPGSELPVNSAGTLAVVQNGPANYASPQQISPNLAGTIIQNSLNDQKIQNVTTINATVNSLQSLRVMSLQNTIQTGIVNSLRR